MHAVSRRIGSWPCNGAACAISPWQFVMGMPSAEIAYSDTIRDGDESVARQGHIYRYAVAPNTHLIM